jgi:flagellar hook-associated protein FlgK
MDEEAVRLIEFEATFQALVRVVQVIDSLTTEILSIVR